MKSKGIHGLSHILIEKHDGKVPQSFEALEALPAVGHKTASVVMSQAFGVPAFPVDTHIHRLMYRWNLSMGKTWCKLKKMPNAFFQKLYGTNLHLQIIWYGREYSPATRLGFRERHHHQNHWKKISLKKNKRRSNIKKKHPDNYRDVF
jgi:endonuclease-3